MCNRKSEIVNRKFFFLFLASALALLYLRLRLLNAGTVRTPRISFGDTAEYLLIAARPLFSADFWVSGRPFMIPLFFKALAGDPNRIFAVQLALSILCWLILALTCALVIRSYPLKFLAFAVVLGFSLTEQVILWDSLVLSESLNFSLAALFYASALLLAARWNRLNAALCIAAAALLAFTRDQTALTFLLAGAVLCLLPLLFQENRRRFFMLGAAFLLIFAVSAAFASAGKNSWRTTLNVVTRRVLSNPEYLAYMQQRGMPVSYLSLPDSANIANWDNQKDPRLAELREWAKAHGTGALLGFLWHFKADALQKPLNDPVAIFAPDLHYYSSTGFKPVLERTRLAEMLYPMRFGVITFWLASLASAFVAALAIRHKKPMWLVPLLMILLAYPLIALVWNVDTNDIYRHALPFNVQWRLGLWLLLFLVADELVGRLGKDAVSGQPSAVS